MNLEEAIKHAEEVAEEQEGRGYCDRSVCVIMDENNHNCDECEVVKCRECAKEHRQLVEWLKELQAHREAWEKVKSELWMEGMNMTGEYQGVWIRYRDIERVINANRPKEGESE